MTDLCVVLGNGPSLKGFDLTRLSGVASLGMNAAYRYWDQIGWYPGYYSCLDDQLIQTHHAEIRRLWAEGRVRRFFLHGTFFDLHPDCVNAPGMHSLDQVLPYWYRRRGRKQGWPDLTGAAAFRTKDTTKITTGAFATRFAAWMGHEVLAIMGVDLKYVEILPEAAPAGGVALVMRETPKSNPNYFFDGYQQAGDRYNIPNPDVHGNALHIRSFEIIAEDFAENGVKARLFNTNPASMLEEKKVFPLCPIDRFLAPEGLGAVMVPTNASEVPAILDNFRIWAQDGFAPFAEPPARGRPALVLVFNNEAARPQEGAIRAAYDAALMGRHFSRLEIRYLDLEGARDRYQRDYSKPVDAEGYKSGPNNQFFLTLAEAEGFGTHVFNMETDCAPLGPGWLGRLDAEVRDCAPFWVLGSRYHGVETLSPDFARHLNGNAVYAVGDAGFRDFARGFWEPTVRRMVAETDRRLAYDCILETAFTRHAADPAVAAVAARARPLLLESGVIVNISGKRDLAELSRDFIADMAARFPQAAILHNRAAQQRLAAAAPALPEAPRLLVLDMTPAGNGTATGEIKANLLAGWPGDRLLQVAQPGTDGFVLVRPDGAGGFAEIRTDRDGAEAAMAEFAPEAILYRPLADRPGLHALAMAAIESRTALPLAVWLMDDWPARAEAADAAAFAPLGADLRALLARAGLRLSISDAMSQAFGARYGVPFRAFANGVDPEVWTSPRQHADGGILVRYAGGLAPDMNAESVRRIALAVEARRAAGQDIRFEISTSTWWKGQSGDLFKGLVGTRLDTARRPFADYVNWLCEADVLVVAYNFDPQSVRYTRYSMANKMPECLASGAALLVHGPRGVATVDYLAEAGVAEVVDQPDTAALESALAGLADRARREALAAPARRLALARHALPALRAEFRLALTRLVTPAPEPAAAPSPAATAGAIVAPLAVGAVQVPRAAPSPPSTPAPPEPAIQPPPAPLPPPVQFLRLDGDAAPQPADAEAATLLLYADPCDRVAAALAQGDDPAAALAAWTEAAAAALDAYRPRRRTCRVVEAGMVAAAPEGALAETGLPAALVPLARAAAGRPDPRLLPLAELCLRRDRTAQRLLAELEASRMPLDGIDSADRLAAARRALAEDQARARSVAGELSTQRIARAAAEVERDRLAAEAARRQAALVETENGMKRLAQRLSQVEARLADQSREAEADRRNLAEARAALRDMVRDAESARARVAALESDLTRETAASHARKRELTAVNRALAEARAEIDHFYRSHSWRVTAPLRALRRLFGRGGG